MGQLLRAHDDKQNTTRADSKPGRGWCDCRIYENSALRSSAWSMVATFFALILVHGRIPSQHSLLDRVTDASYQRPYAINLSIQIRQIKRCVDIGLAWTRRDGRVGMIRCMYAKLLNGPSLFNHRRLVHGPAEAILKSTLKMRLSEAASTSINLREHNMCVFQTLPPELVQWLGNMDEMNEISSSLTFCSPTCFCARSP